LVVLASGCGDCLFGHTPGYEVVPGACSYQPAPDAGGAPDADLDDETSPAAQILTTDGPFQDIYRWRYHRRI
jgi:hypothetical protein